MNLDTIIPPASAVRSNIASFLPAAEILEAAQINDHWFNSLALWPTWRYKFMEVDVLRDCVEFGEEFLLPLPKMYANILSACSSDPILCASLKDSLTADRFFATIGNILGQATARYTVQFPLLHVYIRHPVMYDGTMPIDAPPARVAEDELANPPSAPNPLYKPAPRIAQIYANITRWHFVDPREEDVPWMLSFHDWAQTTQQPYHKFFAGAAVYLLRSPKATVILKHEDVKHLIGATIRALRHLLGDKKDAASSPTATPATSTSSYLLDDTDPRQLYSILEWCRRVFPEWEEEVQQALYDFCGEELGAVELQNAARRVEEAVRGAAQRKRDHRRRVRAEMNAYREEHGVAPLPDSDDE